jgi:hypothetical protein
MVEKYNKRAGEDIPEDGDGELSGLFSVYVSCGGREEKGRIEHTPITGKEEIQT